MTRFIFILLSFITFSFAAVKNLEGIYNIEYGIFGKLGTAEASIKVNDNNTYEINAKAYATGLAKTLSGNRVEEYISKGSFMDNAYKPTYFKKTIRKRSDLKVVEFFFDHQNKKILKKEYKKQRKRKVDPTDITNIEYELVENSNERILPYWTSEDILSLFFNVKKYVDTDKKGTKSIVSAIGASDKREGKIDILIPDQNRYNEISNYIKDDGDILIVKVYKKIFASKDGEFFISVDEDGLCSKSVLKDVMFFGDITATLEKKNKI